MPDLFLLPAPRAMPPGLLSRAVLLCLALVPVTLLLLALDRRALDDEALWLKPLKFQLSLALHGARGRGS